MDPQCIERQVYFLLDSAHERVVSSGDFLFVRCQQTHMFALFGSTLSYFPCNMHPRIWLSLTLFSLGLLRWTRFIFAGHNPSGLFVLRYTLALAVGVCRAAFDSDDVGF